MRTVIPFLFFVLLASTSNASRKIYMSLNPASTNYCNAAADTLITICTLWSPKEGAQAADQDISVQAETSLVGDIYSHVGVIPGAAAFLTNQTYNNVAPGDMVRLVWNNPTCTAATKTHGIPRGIQISVAQDDGWLLGNCHSLWSSTGTRVWQQDINGGRPF